MRDVVILGAGMAGMACARTLLQQGHRPLVVAPRHAIASRGETLSFRAAPFLDKLGWQDLLDSEAAVPCQGRYSVWGHAALRRDPQHEDASGWHVDRRLFETRMADTLAADGLERLDSEARRLSRSSSQVAVELADGSSIAARFLVDCTGRAAVSAGTISPPRRLDRLVACYGVFALDDDVEAIPATLVEAVEDGWWYMTIMPARRCLLCFFTDSDLLPAGIRKDASLWAGMTAQTGAIAARLDSLGLHAAACGELLFAPASSVTMSHLVEHRVIRAGDAASALDPLGANGLATALWSGIQAAESVVGALAGDDTASRHYEQKFLEGITSFLITQRAMYASERRFAGAPFWMRRSGAPGPAS